MINEKSKNGLLYINFFLLLNKNYLIPHKKNNLQ